jgi:hypothetical protein
VGTNFRRSLATAIFSPEGGIAYYSEVLVLNSFTTQTPTVRLFTLFKPHISFQIWFLNNETDSIASVKCGHMRSAQCCFFILIADHVTSHKDSISILPIALFAWRWTRMTVSFGFRNARAKKIPNWSRCSTVTSTPTFLPTRFRSLLWCLQTSTLDGATRLSNPKQVNQLQINRTN